MCNGGYIPVGDGEILHEGLICVGFGSLTVRELSEHSLNTHNLYY